MTVTAFGVVLAPRWIGPSTLSQGKTIFCLFARVVCGRVLVRVEVVPLPLRLQ
jgi:hypothetical protein